MEEEAESYMLEEIPDIFKSDLTETYFEKCTICSVSLLDPPTNYIVEKAFKHHAKFNITDTVFEYAVCMDCYQKIHKQFSKSSKQRVEAYFRENTDLVGRKQHNFSEGKLGLENWLGNCAVKGTDKDTLGEYQIAAHFVGDKMLLHEFPILLSGEAVDEIQELLSPETRGEIDGLTDQFLGLPPEFKEALKKGDYIIF